MEPILYILAFFFSIYLIWELGNIKHLIKQNEQIRSELNAWNKAYAQATETPETTTSKSQA